MSFTAVGAGFHRTVVETLVTEQCVTCHILFAMPADLQKRALNDKSINFYCPNGHSQIYTSDKLRTLETQLQREREAKQAALARQDELRAERDHHWTERKKLRTRHSHLKQRVKHGVCPCCHRTFKQLAEHMKARHPHYAKPGHEES